MKKPSSNHWSNYWQNGSLTSLPQDFKENYDGEIYNYWYKLVSEFKNNSTVLDICTGNGAIAILIKEISIKLNLSLKIIAVDAANIEPKNLLNKHPNKKNIIKDITFIGNTLIENIDEVLKKKVDYIVSQYGVEYCDIKAIAPKLSKIIHSKGKLFFISHSSETDVIKYMKDERLDYKALEEFNIFSSFEKFNNKEYTPVKFKKKLKNHIKQILRYYSKDISNLTQEWLNAMSSMIDMPIEILNKNKSKIIDFSLQHKFARDRALDLLRVSEMISKNPKWYSEFEKYDFKLVDNDIIWYQARYNAGHYYKLEKK